MKKRVLSITRKGFGTIYVIEDGTQLSEIEFIKFLCLPHGYELVIRTVDMLSNDNWICEKHESYYFPYLCSKIANYDFTNDEFNTLWSCGHSY